MLLSLGLGAGALDAQVPDSLQNNGVIDGVTELATRQERMIYMKDSVPLATDFFIPIISDNLGFRDLQVDIGAVIGGGSFNVTVPYLKLADAGTQLYRYPQQADPRQLPMILTRTPYNKQDPTQGTIEALMGYCGVVQDMRGRYASAGTYYPMYSDGWVKTPYYGDTIGHLLDTTANRVANTHEDGYETVQHLLSGARWDYNGDSVLNSQDPLITDGKIGMFGASALGNSQLQAAAAHRSDASTPGLQCLFPIVATGEHYYTTGHYNGLFRERIIDGWLTGRIAGYDAYNDSVPDTSINNYVHSLHDYGPQAPTAAAAAELAIDNWTEHLRGHYPDSRGRSAMDISAAPVDSTGAGDPDGQHSRYENMQLPQYHLSGWWDIFVDGQLRTWALSRRHVRPEYKDLQKIVIGPWAHQTIGTRATGAMRQGYQGEDYRYPENVAQALGVAANLDNLNISQFAQLGNSDLLKWFRAHLGGSPEVQLPPLKEWQFVLDSVPPLVPDSAFIMAPADTFETSFVAFFNFLNGADTLRDFPVRIKGVNGQDSNQVQRVDVPPLPNSVFGDSTNTKLESAQAIDWRQVPNVRFYMVGPVQDGVAANADVGNYWYGADTFPLPNQTTAQRLYFHADGSLSATAPQQDEGTRTIASDPNNPVPTHGGGNMIVHTPDGARNSQGQMDFANPQYQDQVLTRDSLTLNGENYADLISFTSAAIEDSFSIAGIPNATLYAKAQPMGGMAQDSTNADFVVRVVDVYPDGRQLYVFEGAVSARARKYAASWVDDGRGDPNAPFSNIVTDSIYEFQFQTMPIGYTFGEGHKIKVLISNSNYPRYQANPNLPLEHGTFHRREPGDGQTFNYYGQSLMARRQLSTFAFSEVYDGHINFPVLGKDFTVDRPQAQAPPSKPGLQVRARPNPAQDVLYVDFQQHDRYELRLMNSLGQTVRRRQARGYGARMDVADLPAGVYFLKALRPTTGEARSVKVLVR
jgi:predicted acyl esterase